MGTLIFAKRTFAAIIFTCAVLALTCCGSGESEAVAQDPQIDPRFATAEALVAHYNSIATREPVDVIAAYDLCYAETDLQRRYISTSKEMLPLAQLDHLMHERFGEGFSGKSKKSMLAADRPAHLESIEESRAQGAYVDSEGKTRQLYLVRMNDRWWVSGYTFEYDADFAEYKTEMDALERLGRMLSTAAPTVTAEIRDGTITSAKNARRRMGELILQNTNQTR